MRRAQRVFLKKRHVGRGRGCVCEEGLLVDRVGEAFVVFLCVSR